MQRMPLIPFLLICSTSFAADALSPEAQALIAPVHEAYQRVEREQATLPPPKDNAERLTRLGKIDQVGREAKAKVNLSTLSAEQRNAAFAAINAEINRHDLANQTALEMILPPEGWFLKSRYGAEASEAAFLIVQHAVNNVGLPVYDKELQHKTLAAMKPLVAMGEVDGQDYALLYDRVQIFDGLPQLYGTQMTCKESKYVLDRLDDPEHVNERRKAMGFALTVQQNVARFANRPPCS